MNQPHELIQTRYTTEAGKQQYLRNLFNQGARHYDRIGSLGSFGTGHWYRKRALLRAGLRPGMKVLDVACGTGAVTRAILNVLAGEGSVVGLDPSTGMLAEARAKVGAHFVQGQAEDLPFPEASFDFLSMGYALRHVMDLDRAFAEYRRVLKPGGRVLLLEITRPKRRFGFLLARFYFRDCLPLFMRLLGSSRTAREMVAYYWETIEACVPPESILTALKSTGFSDVTRHVEAGLFSEYRATWS